MKDVETAQEQRGPVRILCDEIGFDFDPCLERPEVLVAFVRELVGEIERERGLAVAMAERFGTKAPSDGSAEVLLLAGAMLAQQTRSGHIGSARLVHEASDRFNPEGEMFTDHTIDMLSSCASAIRFGLESPCQSRHAAEAATDVWRRRYGVSLLDENTSAWRKGWARSKLLSAIISLIPEPSAT